MLRRKLGFTLIETLVVMTIIAILAAILIPVLSAARAKAKLTACTANLYQFHRTGEMDGDGQQSVDQCPYPSDDSGFYIDVRDNYRSRDPNQVPDGGTVITYCIQHLSRGNSSTLEVPLKGKFSVARFAGGSGIVDAKGVERWRKTTSGWSKITETGEVPVWPEIWHFPRDDFPSRPL
jgi:prepilin-type N-terminal cleavage/methylation domain-containing protein